MAYTPFLFSGLSTEDSEGILELKASVTTILKATGDIEIKLSGGAYGSSVELAANTQTTVYVKGTAVNSVGSISANKRTIINLGSHNGASDPVDAERVWENQTGTTPTCTINLSEVSDNCLYIVAFDDADSDTVITGILPANCEKLRLKDVTWDFVGALPQELEYIFLEGDNISWTWDAQEEVTVFTFSGTSTVDSVGKLRLKTNIATELIGLGDIELSLDDITYTQTIDIPADVQVTVYVKITAENGEGNIVARKGSIINLGSHDGIGDPIDDERVWEEESGTISQCIINLDDVSSNCKYIVAVDNTELTGDLPKFCEKVRLSDIVWQYIGALPTTLKHIFLEGDTIEWTHTGSLLEDAPINVIFDDNNRIRSEELDILNLSQKVSKLNTQGRLAYKHIIGDNKPVDYADVTSENTANDTENVAGSPSETVQANAQSGSIAYSWGDHSSEGYVLSNSAIFNNDPPYDGVFTIRCTDTMSYLDIDTENKIVNFFPQWSGEFDASYSVNAYKLYANELYTNTINASGTSYLQEISVTDILASGEISCYDHTCISVSTMQYLLVGVLEPEVYLDPSRSEIAYVHGSLITRDGYQIRQNSTLTMVIDQDGKWTGGNLQLNQVIGAEDVSQSSINHIEATSSIHGATSNADFNKIIIRDSNGRARVEAPDDDRDITNKTYVDELVGGVTTGYVTQSRTVASGDGLTGGGSLESNITLTLGAPSDSSTTTTNNASANSHTHKITGVLKNTGDNPSSITKIHTITALDQLEPTLTSNDNNYAKFIIPGFGTEFRFGTLGECIDNDYNLFMWRMPNNIDENGSLNVKINYNGADALDRDSVIWRLDYQFVNDTPYGSFVTSSMDTIYASAIDIQGLDAYALISTQFNDEIDLDGHYDSTKNNILIMKLIRASTDGVVTNSFEVSLIFNSLIFEYPMTRFNEIIL